MKCDRMTCRNDTNNLVMLKGSHVQIIRPVCDPCIEDINRKATKDGDLRATKIGTREVSN